MRVRLARGGVDEHGAAVAGDQITATAINKRRTDKGFLAGKLRVLGDVNHATCFGYMACLHHANVPADRPGAC